MLVTTLGWNLHAMCDRSATHDCAGVFSQLLFHAVATQHNQPDVRCLRMCMLLRHVCRTVLCCQLHKQQYRSPCLCMLRLLPRLSALLRMLVHTAQTPWTQIPCIVLSCMFDGQKLLTRIAQYYVAPWLPKPHTRSGSSSAKRSF